MKLFIVPALAALLAGCVVYLDRTESLKDNPDQAPSSQTQSQTLHIVLPPPPSGDGGESPPPPPTVIEKVVTEEVVVTELCERFVWPNATDSPPQADFVQEVLANRAQYTPEQINDALLDYVFTLRTFMEAGYSQMREEYTDYLKRCGYEPDTTLPKHLYTAP